MSDEKVELRPCPFCGYIPRLDELHGHTGTELDVYRFRVRCKKCGVCSNLFATKEEAIEAWNTRDGEGE